jgi:hypothetical protein
MAQKLTAAVGGGAIRMHGPAADAELQFTGYVPSCHDAK